MQKNNEAKNMQGAATSSALRANNMKEHNQKSITSMQNKLNISESTPTLKITFHKTNLEAHTQRVQNSL